MKLVKAVTKKRVGKLGVPKRLGSHRDGNGSRLNSNGSRRNGNGHNLVLDEGFRPKGFEWPEVQGVERALKAVIKVGKQAEAQMDLTRGGQIAFRVREILREISVLTQTCTNGKRSEIEHPTA